MFGDKVIFGFVNKTLLKKYKLFIKKICGNIIKFR